jgi:N-acetylmuramic acid 6-phosphate etherase
LPVKKNKTLFDQLRKLTTEQSNPRSRNIDRQSIPAILRTIAREDATVPSAVRREIPHIARAVDLVVRSLKHGGRLIYVGAGTSGRLGILDAAECPPTFGTPPGMVQGVIAGGKSAVFRAIEGSEDLQHGGESDIRRKKVGDEDVVCGIAASMRTPYVIGALREAKRRGASTILVTTNSRSRLAGREFAGLRKSVDVAICPVVGPEAIMGSTRMKAGTAQKLVLNMITTASMVRLGKIHGNLMIDLRLNSRKLEERAKRIVMMTTGLGYPAATAKLREAGGQVKTAIVMAKLHITARQARARIKKAGGFVRAALQDL